MNQSYAASTKSGRGHLGQPRSAKTRAHGTKRPSNAITGWPEAVIGHTSLEHVKLRSSWTITVPSQGPKASPTTPSLSGGRPELLQGRSPLSVAHSPPARGFGSLRAPPGGAVSAIHLSRLSRAPGIAQHVTTSTSAHGGVRLRSDSGGMRWADRAMEAGPSALACMCVRAQSGGRAPETRRIERSQTCGARHST